MASEFNALVQTLAETARARETDTTDLIAWCSPAAVRQRQHEDRMAKARLQGHVDMLKAMGAQAEAMAKAMKPREEVATEARRVQGMLNELKARGLPDHLAHSFDARIAAIKLSAMQKITAAETLANVGGEDGARQIMAKAANHAEAATLVPHLEARLNKLTGGAHPADMLRDWRQG